LGGAGLNREELSRFHGWGAIAGADSTRTMGSVLLATKITGRAFFEDRRWQLLAH
jgi:hypothetical protein